MGILSCAQFILHGAIAVHELIRLLHELMRLTHTLSDLLM